MATEISTQNDNSNPEINNSTYTTEKYQYKYRGHNLNVTVSKNEIGDKALEDLAKLILKYF